MEKVVVSKRDNLKNQNLKLNQKSQNTKQESKPNKLTAFFSNLFKNKKLEKHKNKYLNKKPNNQNSVNKNHSKFQNATLVVKSIFKNHYKYITILFVLFVLFLITLLVTFNKSLFYDFINRPKILKSEVVVVILLLLSAIFCIVEFFVNLLYLHNSNKKHIKENDLQYNKKQIKSNIKKIYCKFGPIKNISKTSFKNLKTTKKKRKIRFAYKKNKKPANKYMILKLNLYILTMLLLLCLSFKIKVLWVCVFAIFTVCALNINLLVCNKTKQSRVLNFLMLLVNICIFFSFYLIYLLN